MSSRVDWRPFDALSAQSGVALALERYRDASRREARNLRFDALIELGRPNRFVILADIPGVDPKDVEVSLADGEVYDHTVECWLHGSCFDMRTGKPIFYTSAILSDNLHRIMFQCNPLAQIMAFSRAVLIDGAPPSVACMTYVLAFGAVITAAGLFVFKRFEQSFPERL